MRLYNMNATILDEGEWKLKQTSHLGTNLEYLYVEHKVDNHVYARIARSPRYVKCPGCGKKIPEHIVVMRDFFNMFDPAIR
jgi:hypothetical protein